MQGPGGPDEDPSNGFTAGGWTLPYRHEAGGRAVAANVAGEFDMLLGRRTYDNFASFWPHNNGHPIGKAFNEAKKYVATRKLDTLTWEHSKRIGPDIVADVSRLKASDGPELHIWGSSELLQILIAADLIDEFRMLIYPVVVGEGKRLFGTPVGPRSLELVSTQATPTDVLVNVYRPAKSG